MHAAGDAAVDTEGSGAGGDADGGSGAAVGAKLWVDSEGQAASSDASKKRKKTSAPPEGYVCSICTHTCLMLVDATFAGAYI